MLTVLIIGWGADTACAAPRPPKDAEVQDEVPSDWKELKTQDPDAYQRLKHEWDRQKQMDQLVQAVNAQQLSRDEAVQRLLPLVKEIVHEQLNDADGEIESWRARISELERMKRNPDRFVEERINQILPSEDSNH